MFSIFNKVSTAEVLGDWIRAQANRGRGYVKAMAETLDVASPQISQFLSGKKVPTLDQAYRLTRFFHWNEAETEYFMTLVDYERCAHYLTKAHLMKKMKTLRANSLKISKSVAGTIELTDPQKAQFYSSWIYSAIRLFCSVGDGKTFEEIFIKFPDCDVEVGIVVEFLEKAQLIKKNGARYVMGPLKTFVPKGSPYLRSHHCNWRIRAIERANFISDEELMFTSPISISSAGYKKVRSELQEWIKKIYAELPVHGDAEEVVCLNLDFFKVLK